MTFNIDPNMVNQVGLDSAALTMLGVVVHNFREPGLYRGVVRRGGDPEAAFYIHADPDSPVAQVTIDLAKLAIGGLDGGGAADSGCGCADDAHRYVVNPKGYAVFHVSGGAGGYNVFVRKAEDRADAAIFDSRELGAGDVFSGVILRPGTYSISNALGKAPPAKLVAAYPRIGKTAYRPPAPQSVELGERGFEPQQIELQPLQGLNVRLKTRARIRIELIKPDDGPHGGMRRPRPGWTKPVPA
jgi:hypothetical protein